MENSNGYQEAVSTIKKAILISQYDAISAINEKQLMLYYGIGKYISINSRKGFWGKGAIEQISQRLEKELPGLRGFNARSLRYMRTFYEAWKILDCDYSPKQGESNPYAVIEFKQSKKKETAITPVLNSSSANTNFPLYAFLHVGFAQHRLILERIKNIDARLFYISKSANEHLSYKALLNCIIADEYHHQGTLPNNFRNTLLTSKQALRALNAFKDEYLLDYINVEEIDARDKEDVDERVLEKHHSQY